MAPLNLYDISIPPMQHGFRSLQVILKKAEEHCDAQKIPHEEFLQTRLIADMLPLVFQIQTCSNTAKYIPVRVTGAENVAMEDNETTFEQLQTRIERTIEFLDKSKREDFEGKEDVEVLFRDWKFTGLNYLTQFAIPNFYFHYTTAYNILRMKGVSVGKLDYLGNKKQWT